MSDSVTVVLQNGKTFHVGIVEISYCTWRMRANFKVLNEVDLSTVLLQYLPRDQTQMLVDREVTQNLLLPIYYQPQ